MDSYLPECGLPITGVAWLAASTVWHIMRRCQQKGEVSQCLAMVFLVSIRVVITFWLSDLSLLRGR